jgi:hypothetical protein
MSINHWQGLQANIHHRLLHEDVKDFLGWSSIVATMFVGEAPYIALERQALLEAGWGDVLELQEWGGQPSTNLLHQAYHLLRWEQVTGECVSNLDSILEIGAGYGAMARVARARGFTGRYTIMDLPEMAKIQKFYLAQYGVEAEWRRAGEKVEAELLISLWGLSELPLRERERLIDSIEMGLSHVLLAYQDMWGDELSNEIYFPQQFAGDSVDINHLPGHQYLIG